MATSQKELTQFLRVCPYQSPPPPKKYITLFPHTKKNKVVILSL
jgi:hypothetical protein